MSSMSKGQDLPIKADGNEYLRKQVFSISLLKKAMVKQI